MIKIDKNKVRIINYLGLHKELTQTIDDYIFEISKFCEKFNTIILSKDDILKVINSDEKIIEELININFLKIENSKYIVCSKLFI